MEFGQTEIKTGFLKGCGHRESNTLEHPGALHQRLHYLQEWEFPLQDWISQEVSYIVPPADPLAAIPRATDGKVTLRGAEALNMSTHVIWMQESHSIEPSSYVKGSHFSDPVVKQF